MWIGSQHPNSPYVEIGQITTAFYCKGIANGSKGFIPKGGQEPPIFSKA